MLINNTKKPPRCFCCGKKLNNRLYSAMTINTLKQQIKDYIAKHGLGSPCLPLQQVRSTDEFLQHYYTKQELQAYCRTKGISPSGSKAALNHKILIFLQTGHTVLDTPQQKASNADSKSGLSLSKQVVHYKSDALTREFFKQHIPTFKGFSALVQKQIKQRLSNNENLTYQDLIIMHKAHLESKKLSALSGAAKKVAHYSCQYNQFAIDYGNDPIDKVHDLKEAWLLVRNSAGEKTYQRYTNCLKRIANFLESK